MFGVEKNCLYFVAAPVSVCAQIPRVQFSSTCFTKYQYKYKSIIVLCEIVHFARSYVELVSGGPNIIVNNVMSTKLLDHKRI